MFVERTFKQSHDSAMPFVLCVYTTMNYCVYSVAHTHIQPIQELADRYEFRIYRQRLNTYVYLWCIVLPMDNPHATHILLQYSDQLTYMYDV